MEVAFFWQASETENQYIPNESKRKKEKKRKERKREKDRSLGLTGIQRRPVQRRLSGSLNERWEFTFASKVLVFDDQTNCSFLPDSI
jgi:hypothetical protein